MHRGCLTLWTVVLGVALAVGAAGLAADAKPKTPPSPSPNIGEMLYHARCLHCHDFPNPGCMEETRWNRWMARMRYTAGLSDEDYDLVMDYAFRERKARLVGGVLRAGAQEGNKDTFKRKARIEELAPSGGWCWFQDPRAVYYEGKHRRTYAGWVTLAGDIQVASIDADTGETLTSTLREKLEPDDHDAPVILVTPDGHLTVFYSKHNGPDLFYRRSLKPENVEQWGPEQTIPTNTKDGKRYKGFTYYHPMQLSAEGGKTYLFWRGGNWKPTFSTTMDGKTWTEARNLLMSNEPRPYMKVCSNGRDSIHFAYTSGDPNPKETKVTSLFYAAYKNGTLHRADGRRICTLDEVPFEHTKGDRVWDHEATGHRAWVWDIALDAEEKPVVVFVTLPNAEDDHRYQYARWNGKKWNVHKITRSAGGFTLPRADGTRTSPSYSGGVTLNHSDPSTVYVSAKRSGVFEIEKWTTPDQGKTWTSEAITSGSKKNNVRPVVPWGFNGRGVEVLWMHGDYYFWKAQYHTAIHMRIAKGGR